MATIDDLDSARQRIFDSINELRGFFESDPQAQGLTSFFDGAAPTELLGQLQGRAAGTDGPFTETVLNSLLGQSADSSAEALARENDLVRQSFANAGLGGSGLAASAMVNARRRASAATRRGRRDITSRAELENFQARERAQASVQNYLNQQLAAQQAQAAMALQLQQQAQAQEQRALSQFKETKPLIDQNVYQGAIGWQAGGGPSAGATGNPWARNPHSGKSTIISSPTGSGIGNVYQGGGGGGISMGNAGGAAYAGYSPGRSQPFAVAPQVNAIPSSFQSFGSAPANRIQRPATPSPQAPGAQAGSAIGNVGSAFARGPIQIGGGEGVAELLARRDPVYGGGAQSPGLANLISNSLRFF